MPDQGDAEKAYATHQAAIDDIVTTLEEALHAMPMTHAVRCKTAEEVAAAHDPAMDAEFEVCRARRGRWLEGCYEGWKHFRQNTAKALLNRHHALLGLSVQMRAATSSMRYPVTTGTTSPSQTGVPAAQGFSRGRRRVGYHRYQTAVAFPTERGELVRRGDKEHRDGLEITYTVTDGDLTADVTIVLLMEGETPEDWRASHVARLMEE